MCRLSLRNNVAEIYSFTNAHKSREQLKSAPFAYRRARNLRTSQPLAIGYRASDTVANMPHRLALPDLWGVVSDHFSRILTPYMSLLSSEHVYNHVSPHRTHENYKSVQRTKNHYKIFGDPYLRNGSTDRLHILAVCQHGRGLRFDTGLTSIRLLVFELGEGAPTFSTSPNSPMGGNFVAPSSEFSSDGTPERPCQIW